MLMLGVRFQVDEIDSADLKPDEEEEIESLYQRASNSSKLVELSSKMATLLEQNVNQSLAEVQRAADRAGCARATGFRTGDGEL